MSKLRGLSIVILILLVSYVLADKSGFINYFDDMVHQRNGWVETNNGYSRTSVERIHRISVTLLKDPESKTFNLYEGAMKKAAVDRMELVTTLNLDVTDTDSIKSVILSEAQKLKCNTAIINGKITHHRTTSESFAF